MANLPPDVVMDVDKINNFDDVRRRSSSFSKVSSRSASMSSSTSTIPYPERMAANNNLLDDDKKPIDSPRLSYKGDSQERDHVSMAADLIPPQGLQCVSNKALALNTCNIPHVDDDNVINIQLLYDPD